MKGRELVEILRRKNFSEDSIAEVVRILAACINECYAYNAELARQHNQLCALLEQQITVAERTKPWIQLLEKKFGKAPVASEKIDTEEGLGRHDNG